MDPEVRKVLGWLACYWVIGLLTFGWTINHSECREYSFGPDCSERNVGAALSGVLWPLVLPARVAVLVTKWP